MNKNKMTQSHKKNIKKKIKEIDKAVEREGDRITDFDLEMRNIQSSKLFAQLHMAQ